MNLLKIALTININQKKKEGKIDAADWHKGTTLRGGKFLRVRERSHMPLFTDQPKDSHSPNL